MDNYLSFLGNSQTFLGVISTIIILFMFKDSDGNFLFKILSDIKKYVVEKISKSKPEISFQSFKQEPSFKSVLLYSQRDNDDEKTESLKNECAELCMKVDSEQIQFQSKLTSWDEDVDRFATIISEKTELQISPMFIFAYTIVVFIIDELLRCSFIPGNAFLLSSFYLLTIFVFMFWAAKWLCFLVIDENTDCASEINNIKGATTNNWIQKFLVLISGSITKFVLFIIVQLLVVYGIAEHESLPLVARFWFLLGLIMVLSIIYGYISTPRHKSKDTGGIYTRHVFSFVSMVITSISICALINICYPEILECAHLQDEVVIFWAKLVCFFIILSFGLVFPFTLPLLRYLFMYIKAELLNVWYEILVQYTMWKLKSSFMELSKKIPV